MAACCRGIPVGVEGVGIWREGISLPMDLGDLGELTRTKESEGAS